MKCELISSLGDDLTVVNSARVSFENELTTLAIVTGKHS